MAWGNRPTARVPAQVVGDALTFACPIRAREALRDAVLDRAD